MDNTPVSGNQEDHVSMSAQSALSARDVLENVQTVIAIELLCGAQAAEFVDETLSLGDGTGAAYEAIRDVVPELVEDRPIHEDVEVASALASANEFLTRIEDAVDEELA